MNLPSIRTLEEAFPGMGRTLRSLLESPPPDGARTRMWRLAALNAELGFHGVEYVRPGRGSRSPGFEYLNTGYTYAPTIVRFSDGRYRVSDIGSILERGNYEQE